MHGQVFGWFELDNMAFLQAMLRRPFAFLLVCSSLAFCADDPPTTTKPPEKVPVRKEVVVVTGVFEPLPLDEVDRDVTAFPTREQPLLFPNWADYLEQDSSLDLRMREPGGIHTDLSIRGADFSQTLVLVNGLRVNDAQSGHHDLDQPLPMNSLERIEVLRGAGSTLYGADALGGAVNFITAPPAVSEFRLGTAFGNFGINQQSGSAAYASQRFSEQLTFERDFSTGFMPDRDYSNEDASSESWMSSRLGRSSRAARSRFPPAAWPSSRRTSSCCPSARAWSWGCSPAARSCGRVTQASRPRVSRTSCPRLGNPEKTRARRPRHTRTRCPRHT